MAPASDVLVQQREKHTLFSRDEIRPPNKTNQSTIMGWNRCFFRCSPETNREQVHFMHSEKVPSSHKLLSKLSLQKKHVPRVANVVGAESLVPKVGWFRFSLAWFIIDLDHQAIIEIYTFLNPLVGRLT